MMTLVLFVLFVLLYFEAGRLHWRLLIASECNDYEVSVYEGTGHEARAIKTGMIALWPVWVYGIKLWTKVKEDLSL